MSWRKVDTSKENFGSFNDCIFFELEEINWEDYSNKSNNNKGNTKNAQGNLILSESNQSTNQEIDTENEISETKSPNLESSDVKSDKKSKKKKKDKIISVDNIEDILPSKRQADEITQSSDEKDEPIKIDPVHLSSTYWGSVKLPSCLAESLLSLSFNSPTPIQQMSISTILKYDSDIIGTAVTGSGKTLAFVIPVLTSLLYKWEALSTSKKPYCLIFTPTRELATQISTVVKSVCQSPAFQTAIGKHRVEVVNIIGGMSEQKQQRQLNGKRPVHVIVATPGRFCELVKDDSNIPLRNLSSIQYLIIDEVDRMIEEGYVN